MQQKGFLITFFVFWLYSNPVFSDYTFNMHPGSTPISQEIYRLHMLIFWICVAIGIATFSVMIYAMIFHRKSRGAIPATFHDNTWLEIIWTLIPLGILIAMAIPATGVMLKMENTQDSDLTIKITGFMWRWQYDYLNENLTVLSNLKTTRLQVENRDQKSPDYLLEVDNPLVVPIEKKIRFLTTANDVIHSWWVPLLGIKKDAIPGFINETWAIIEKPGIYRGQCAELCGANHGYMPIVVIAKTQAEYEQWVNTQKAKGKSE